MQPLGFVTTNSVSLCVQYCRKWFALAWWLSLLQKRFWYLPLDTKKQLPNAHVGGHVDQQMLHWDTWQGLCGQLWLLAPSQELLLCLGTVTFIRSDSDWRHVSGKVIEVVKCHRRWGQKVSWACRIHTCWNLVSAVSRKQRHFQQKSSKQKKVSRIKSSGNRRDVN